MCDDFWSHLDKIMPVFNPEIPGLGDAQSRNFGIENMAGIWDLEFGLQSLFSMSHS